MYQNIIDLFASIPPYLQALLGATFTWGMTALGAAMVFFFRNIRRRTMDITLALQAE